MADDKARLDKTATGPYNYPVFMPVFKDFNLPDESISPFLFLSLMFPIILISGCMSVNTYDSSERHFEQLPGE